MLYTAQAYYDRVKRLNSSLAPTVQQALAAHVRCPYLSNFWLSATVMSDERVNSVLRPHKLHLREMLLLRLALATGPSSAAEPAFKLHGLAAEQQSAIRIASSGIPLEVPASWRLGPRTMRPHRGEVRLTWAVDVNSLRLAALTNAPRPNGVHVRCERTTPPLQGISWEVLLSCGGATRIPGGPGSSVSINLVVAPKNPLSGCYYCFNCQAVCSAAGIAKQVVIPWTRSRPAVMGNQHSFEDFFGVGAMPGGWTNTAWAAKGLPTTGILMIDLTLSMLDSSNAAQDGV